MNEKQVRVIDAVLRERAYQDDKWGAPWYNDHPISAWLLILERELSEAKEAWVTEEGDQGALLEILQVAAVAFAYLEQHGVVEREKPREAARRET